MKDLFVKVVAGLVIAGSLACFWRLDYLAYRQRYPQAAAWTYWFQGSR